MNTEHGRTMIETLGVLAIIGVITVGSLAGYRTAMNKLRANAITELVAEISVEAQTHNQRLDLSDLDDVGEIHCLADMKGASNGQVKITFAEGCDDIKEIFKTSFAKCKLDDKGDYILYIPNRSSQCKAAGCDEGYDCDAYTPATF